MSIQILKALMQLFAIIGRPESNSENRRSVVEMFLKRQFNKDICNEYIKIFDDYYTVHQEKLKEVAKRKKRTSSISVRVLAICTGINEELTQRQKLIVLVNLLEFLKCGGDEITYQELAFIGTVSDIFNFPAETLSLLKAFVLFPFKDIPDSEYLLLIDGNKEKSRQGVKHIYREYLNGEVGVLNAPCVNMFLVRYKGKSELYLNNQLLLQERIYVFDNGTSLRNRKIEPVYYSDITGAFRSEMISSVINFEAKDIEYRFREGTTGLNKMTFSEESGHLIGIMGSSGSGKTTLLNTLNGNLKPSSGSIRINGIDIHSEKEKIEGMIGYVSQDDLLIEDLTVFRNLYYNAKLCFGDNSEEEIVTRVNNLLRDLGLYEIKDLQVGTPLNKKISGGQRKRLNIALELIRQPAILFLDEPTSGLSSMDSENILDLLKELALMGKLVFVVIHQPSSDIFKMFDKLIILDTGGYLIYYGNPVDSIVYFKSCVQHANWNESECSVCGNVNPEQVFNIVEAKVLDEFGRATRSRKISPAEWAEFFRRNIKKTEASNKKYEKLPAINFMIPNRIKQSVIFVKRDLLAKLANKQYLLINILEPLFLAFLLSYIIKYYSVNVSNQLGYTFAGNLNVPVYLFMAVIVAIFIGLTVSAEEIIKDRKILKREAFLNLSWGSYLFSKTFILFGISAVQAFLFVLAGNSIIEVKGMFFEYWLVLFSAWCFSNVLGLIISDSFKTVITIYILIPFLVIPQLILSGVIVKFEELNPSISSPSRIPLYGEIITSRWAYEALAVYQFRENPYEKELYPYNKAVSRADYKRNFWIRDLQNKVDYSERNLQSEQNQERVSENLELLKNELTKELNAKTNIEADFDPVMLTAGNADSEILEKVRNYLNMLNRYYIELYNNASSRRDRLISEHLQTEQGRIEYMEKKNRHHNEALSELVRNAREIDRIIEYKGELHQKIDPIYREPEGRFIKAHFYSPVKNIFGNQYCTFRVNIGVIWFMVAVLWMSLYFRLLKRGMDLLEVSFSRLSLSKGSNTKRI